MFTTSIRRIKAGALAGILAICLTVIPVSGAAPRLAPRPAMPPAEADTALQQERIAEAFARAPMAFEENRGQTGTNVSHVARGRGYTIFLTPGETVVALVGDESTGRRTLRLRYPGSTGSARFFGETPLEQKMNYMSGSDPNRWITDVPTFASVRCEGVYPGIDMVYYGNQGELEYDFVVAPGADPDVIRLEVDGADRTRLDASGDLVLSIGGRELRQKRPVVYQQPEGAARVPVSCQYRIGGDGHVRLDVGTYDEELPLVVDPVLAYGTYLGGSTLATPANSAGSAIAVDAAGAVYLTGDTPSPNFPGAGTPQIQSEIGGLKDAFVTKLSASGNAIVWSTYLGGVGDDQGSGIAVDSSGAVYLTGQTSSTNFPAVNPLFANPDGAGTDAFVTKIAPAGNAIVWSTYLGGSGVDTADAIAVDAAGAAYVTGLTAATNFPVMNPLFGDTNGFGSTDAFVTKIAPAGNALVWSTYLGGSNFDEGRGIAVDTTGAAYVTGQTQSANFPTVTPLFGDTDGFGNGDCFVAKLTPAGSSLVYSTYLGGATSADPGAAIAVDSTGAAYVTGLTTSTDFPTVNPLSSDTDGFGGGDAYVAKLVPAGNALAWSTYLGGSNFDSGAGIAVDPSGAAYVTGSTSSTDFPTATPLLGDTNGFGNSDGFVTKLAPSGSVLDYSTYLGGMAFDNGAAIAVDSSGAAFVAGITASTDFPTVNPLFGDTDGFGGNDAYAAKLAPAGSSLIFSTHLDGENTQSDTDFGFAIAVDAAGSAYVTGGTDSIDFPVVDPLFGDTDGAGVVDAFVTKFTPDGTGIVWSTFLGGTASDRGLGIKVDAAGSAYVTGNTSSIDFPTVNPLFGDTNGFGGQDAFITKIVPAGNALSYSTYYGGSGLEGGFDIALDPAANAYITGVTGSTNLPTMNPLFGDTDGFGGNDGYVARFTPVGTLAYSTYLGGSVFDRASAIAVDVSGNAYVVGSTSSTNFPTMNPLFGDTDGFGAGDAFVTKLTTAGMLVYSTYLGGSNNDSANGIAVDAAGAAYVSGTTPSTDFPTVNPLFGDTNGFGGSDVFVAKLAPAGGSLVYSTYLGGSGAEFDGKIAVDANGTAYVTGQTVSTNFPAVDPLLADMDGFGGADAFVTKLAATGNALVYSTYLGGSGTEFGNGIAIDSVGSAYVTGQTASPDFTVQSPFDGTLGSNQDAFVAKLVDCTIVCPADVAVSNDAGQCGAEVDFSPGISGSCGVVTCVPASGSFFPVGTTTVTCSTAAGPSCSFAVTVNDAEAPSVVCPPNVVQGTDPNQCSAVVSYAAPAVMDNCPGATAACVPPSGSTFAKGVTTVTCTATDVAGNQSNCAFTVTVNDVQAPSIVCPSNVLTPANAIQNNTIGALVNYPAPAVADNCPGVAAPVCLPAPGSFFPMGVTTVTCSVTDAAGTGATCQFTVAVTTPFDACFVDDATGNTISIVTNPASPLFRLWRLRVVTTNTDFTGNAEFVSVTAGRSLIAYDRDNPLYRMDLNVNFGTRACTATVKVIGSGVLYTIRDRDVTNNPPCQ